MELKLMSSAKRGAKFEVSDHVFAREFNEGLVHQVVTSYMAGGRSGSKRQKNRSDVRGGGIKPFRQKGSGRARAGTIRSPLWRGGGVTFAARPQDHSKKVNKKMYRAAMQCILSELVRQERLVLVKTFEVEQPKTRLMQEKLDSYGLENVLIVTVLEEDDSGNLVNEADRNLCLAARNLHRVEIIDADEVDPVSLVKYEKVVMTEAAVKRIQEKLGN